MTATLSSPAGLLEAQRTYRVEGKYVVLHAGVGIFVKGDVASGDKFAIPGGTPADHQMNLARLVRCGAIRPADEFEATQDKVTERSVASRHQSYEFIIAQHGTEKQRLEARISELQAEVTNLRNYTPAPVPYADESKWMELIGKKDEIIEQQRAQLTALQSQLAALQAAGKSQSQGRK